MSFAVTIASGALVYRQRLTSYRIVRSLVLGIYFLITLQMLVELLRATVFTVGDIAYSFPLTTSLGLAQAVLLLAAAQGIYFSPGTTFGTFFSELANRKRHAALFGLFLALAGFAVLYATFVQPVATSVVTDFAGNAVPSSFVPEDLIAIVIGLYAFFLAYPTTLMVYAASRVAEPKLRQSVLGLGVGWGSVSGLYVAAETYKWIAGVDYTALMYAANAFIFYAVIRNFRRSASLAGFVETAPGAGPTAAEVREEGIPRVTSSLAGKKILYEVDPSVAYESSLRRTLEEMAWAGSAVFVITPSASPLHGALRGATGVKFFLTTSGVSYMKVSDQTSEVMIPQSDTAIFLDIVDKTLHSRQGSLVFVFDSVSELLLMAGLEKAYKFLKEFLELLHEPRSTGVFIFIAKAHQAREVNLLRGLFPSQYVEDASGGRLTK